MRINNNIKYVLIVVLAGLTAACDKSEPVTVQPAGSVVAQIQPTHPAFASSGSPTNVYFGDTHLHTSYSPDAFLMGNQSADPDTAYRYARGLPVVHPYHKARIQIGTPLDFLVVSDHGNGEMESLGIRPESLRAWGKNPAPMVYDDPQKLEVIRVVVKLLRSPGLCAANPPLVKAEFTRDNRIDNSKAQQAKQRHSCEDRHAKFLCHKLTLIGPP